MAVSSPRFFLPFFLLTFVPLSTFTTPESNWLYELNYYTQLADHFIFQKTEATFQQRYLVNATNWGGAASRAPIFVFLGGEVDIEDSARSHGFMFDTATYSKSLVVFIEHRYYGKSLPNAIVEANSTYVSLLSVSQALADHATLIVDLKKNLSAEQSPAIVFGASYAGRALASSSPLLLHVDLSPPGAYNDVVTRTFRNCAELILVADGGSEDCVLGPSSFNYWSFVDYCFSGLLAVNPRRDWYPTEFDGHDRKNVLKRFGSNIIFFNGLKDPWSAGGILESLSDSLVAIVAPKGAHHVDLRPSTAEDPLWLRDVRKQEIQIISKWLEEYQQDHQ